MSELTDINTMEAMSELTDEKTTDAFGELRSIFYKYKKRSTPHVSSSNSWVSQLITENRIDEPVPFQIRKVLKTLAQRIHNDDVEAHKLIVSKQERYGNKDFHKALLTHGTTKDKIAAYMYKCMESPVYNVNELSSLIDFVNPNDKNCNKAISDISSVFETALLPNGHVARDFECHDFMALIPLIKTNFEQVEKQLVLWYFEGQVHLAYLKFLESIEKLCFDTQAKVKTIGAKGFRNVFKNHPRQDTEFALQKLVNKLGDTNKATKGLVLHVLTNIQHDHHDMKLTLISLVQEFLNRPNVSSNGQYACLCLLKDVVLSTYDDCIAERLVKIYFEFFEMCSKKGEVDSRFMATILRGLNRAYPYLKDKKLSVLDKQLEALYKICHLVNFNVGTQALQLIYQVQSSSEDVPSNRFYTILYSKLLDPEFGSSSFKSAFLNVVFKAIVRDNNRSRICAFIRRLLQVSKYQPSEMASGVLFLISEVVKDNLVLKRDLLSLLMTGFNNNNKAVNVKPGTSVPSDDEDEYYSDLDTDGEEADSENAESKAMSSPCLEKKKSEANLKFYSPNGNKCKRKETRIKAESSWVHRDNLMHSDVKQEIRTTKYDPAIRNPLYCGADLLSFWEVANFKHHFHPTVSLFASQLLDRIYVEYSGDPLEDLTLTRFLNRFVQRNPKQIKAEKNKIGAIFGSRNMYVPKGTRNLDVTSSIFKKLEKDKVAPEDLFLHRYFTEYRKNKDVDKKRKRSESDDEEAEDDLFDKLVEKKMSGFGSLGEEDEDSDFDFASKIGGTDRGDLEDDEEDSEVGSENEIDEFNSKSEDLFSGDEDDMDLEDYGSDEMHDFSDEEEYSRTSAKKTKQESYGDWSSKLVDADEIAHLFEENDKLAGTSEAVLNKDKSHAKQLNWEHSRFSSNKKSFKGKEKFKKIHKAKKRKNL